MGVIFVGAMPWIRLFRDGEQESAWAGVVRADWTPHGTGLLLSMRRHGRERDVCTNRTLTDWLWEWYRGPVLAEAGETVQRDPAQVAEVSLEVDLDRGLTAAGGGIELAIREPLDRQLLRRERYPLGDCTPTVSWVRVSCAYARLVVDGEVVPGEPQRGEDRYGIRTTAQINVAEVWTT